MFEHVGVQHLADYFGRIGKLLAPGGVAMNHGITTTDVEQRASPYRRRQFIDKYVFPHGELAHLSTVIRRCRKAASKCATSKTCAATTRAPARSGPRISRATPRRIRQLADPKTFRIWHVYLAGCAYAFAHDWISLYQIVCGKAGQDPAQIPWSRRYMYP
jgi:cyclopropane-fatty-acyl-phospholipid synthase